MSSKLLFFFLFVAGGNQSQQVLRLRLKFDKSPDRDWSRMSGFWAPQETLALVIFLAQAVHNMLLGGQLGMR